MNINFYSVILDAKSPVWCVSYQEMSCLRTARRKRPRTRNTYDRSEAFLLRVRIENFIHHRAQLAWFSAAVLRQVTKM